MSQNMTASIYSVSPATFPTIRDDLRKTFRSGKCCPIEYRRQQLAQLAYMVQDHGEAFAKALHADGGKPHLEIYLGEVGALINHVLYSLRLMEEWVVDRPVPQSEVLPYHKDWDLKTVKAPRGVGLIISPWNYPLILTLGPFVGAIASGCCCVLKPSEVSSNFSNLLCELFPKYMDQSAYRVIPGGVEETTALLDLQWDQIIYIGNKRVGQIVATAAAKYLTPCALELGSQSPVIIAPDLTSSQLAIAAKRIWYGKVANAGQTCVSPNYILVPKDRKDELVEALKKVQEEFYPEGPKAAFAEAEFAGIVNETHWGRVKGLLSRTKGKVIFGGASSEAHGKYLIEPTVVTDVQKDDALLEEEIFGPILPIVSVPDIDAALDFINELPHPLVIYLFTELQKTKDIVKAGTLSGTIAYNDTTGILGVIELPIHGVGDSGYGAWMGRKGFDLFTLDRGSIDVPFGVEDTMAMRYPPYGPQALQFFQDMAKQDVPVARAKQGIVGAVDQLTNKFKYVMAI